MLEISRSVVSIAVANVRAGNLYLYPNSVPAAVALGVRGQIVADEIVAAIFLLNFGEGVAQVAQIEECAPAGICGKSCERIPRILSLICLMKYGSAAKHGGAVGRRGGDVAPGRRGIHPASIDRIDGNVGAIRGVRG